MTTTIKQILLLMSKDLRIEARTRSTIGLVVVLGMLIIVVLGLGLSEQVRTSNNAAPAILWVAYLFGGVMCFEKTMSIERYDGALAALMLAPIDRSVIYFGKLLSNIALMIGLALVVTPMAIVLFGFDLSVAPGSFVLIMTLSMVGFAAVGTLFAAAVSSTSMQGGLLALLIFPICLPLVMTSTQMLNNIFRDQQSAGSGLLLITAFSVMYLVVSWLVFELILEP